MARILGVDQALVERAVRQLERERIIVRDVKIERSPGRFSILSELAG